MPLSYETIGEPSDTPLIFLHGLGGGAYRTASTFPSLPNTYLIAPDMPGHGDSQDFTADDFNFDAFADLVIELMDELGIESCNIGGLSMGSGITLNLALRYPERIQKMIILRPSWLHEKQPDHLKLVAYIGMWIEEAGIDGARTKLLGHHTFKHLDHGNKPVADSIGEFFERPVTPASTAVLYKMWQDAPFTELSQLSTIPNSTLVLTSPLDDLHPQSTADTIASCLPNAETAQLPPRYHEPQEYRLALNAIVSKFLAD
ncbi:MAG: alpha/beta fold hydrolase [Akkermansiaceae bacterium]